VKGFAAWQSVTGAEPSGRYADPLLDADRRPLPGSPVIDGGVPTPFAGDTDLARAPRLQGAAPDVGAVEAAP
jgi:hypothetical protein